MEVITKKQKIYFKINLKSFKKQQEYDFQINNDFNMSRLKKNKNSIKNFKNKNVLQEKSYKNTGWFNIK